MGTYIGFSNSVGATLGALLNPYSDEALALFARMTVEPSSTQKKNLDTLLKAGKTHNWITKGDAFYLFAQETDQAHKLNLIKDAHNCTGSTAFTPNVGTAGDGVSTFLDTNYNPATQAVNLSLNSASFIVGIQTNRAPATKGHGNARLNILPFYFSQQTSKCNDNTNTSFVPLTGASKGISGINRNSATAYNSWKQRVKNALTVTTTSIASGNMYLGAVNTGSAVYLNDDQLSFAFIGGGLTDDEYNYLINDVDVYLRAYNVGLLPYGNSEFIIVSGQSNAVGQAVSTAPSGWEAEQDRITINFENLTGANFQKMLAGTNTGAKWGAEQSASHELLAEKDNDVIVLKVATSGAPITNWGVGQGAYIALQGYLVKVLNNYQNNALTHGTLSLLWMQGENEALNNKTTEYYEPLMRDLITRLRASDTRLANLQIVMSKLPAIQTAYTLAQKAEINDAFANIAADTANCVVLDTDAITGLAMKVDNTHYNDASLLLIGSAWRDLMPA